MADLYFLAAAIALLFAGVCIGYGLGDRRRRQLDRERLTAILEGMILQDRLDDILNPRGAPAITITTGLPRSTPCPQSPSAPG